MYSAFAAMDQNQKNRVDKLYCIRRKLISYQKWMEAASQNGLSIDVPNVVAEKKMVS